MDIISVTSVVDDLQEAERFYGHTLGLPVQREADPAALVVRIGTSQLRLRHAPAQPVCDHLAFRIPADAFEPAKRWLRSRVPPLSQDGQEEFEGPPAWDSHSLYFLGPSRSVLELIARRRLPATAGDTTFSPEQLVCINEVGVAVADVGAAVGQLADVGLAVLGEGSPDFAAVGDDHGLVILARPGRPWLPTSDHLAQSAPLTMDAAGPIPDLLHIGGATVRSAM